MAATKDEFSTMNVGAANQTAKKESAIEAYMQISGVEGDATEENHKGWMKLRSLKFGLSRQFSTQVGQSNNRESSRPNFSSLYVSKDLEQSSLPIFQAASAANAWEKVQVDFCRTGAGGMSIFSSIMLYDVLVDSFQIVQESDGELKELVGLNYSKMELKHTPSDSKGVEGSPKIVGYDLSLAKPV